MPKRHNVKRVQRSSKLAVDGYWIETVYSLLLRVPMGVLLRDKGLSHQLYAEWECGCLERTRHLQLSYTAIVTLSRQSL